MAHYEFVHVDLDDAQHLADLNGISSDLRSTLDLIRYFRASLEKDRLWIEIIDAYSTAILIRYCRAFSSGKRFRIRAKDLPCWNASDKQTHMMYLALRDKHIAHSVNEFEDNQVVAYFNRETVHEEGFKSVSVIHRKLCGLSSLDIDKLENLCRKLISYLDEEVEKEKARILSIVRSKPVDDILNISHTPWIVSMKDANKVRD